MKKALATIGAASTAAIMLALPVSSASAATWHHQYNTFRFPSNQNYCMPGRTLPLRGMYHWTIFGGRSSVVELSRWVRLRGRYRMQDCVLKYQRGYEHEAKLINLSTGGEVRL